MIHVFLGGSYLRNHCLPQGHKILLYYLLKQGSANYGLCGLAQVFINLFFIGTQPFPFIYILSKDSFVLEQQGCVVANETMPPHSQKY